MYSKFVTEPADRECDDRWSGHYNITPMRDDIIRTHQRERDTEKDRERDNIHTDGRREGEHRNTDQHACTHTNMLIQVSYTTVKT